MIKTIPIISMVLSSLFSYHIDILTNIDMLYRSKSGFRVTLVMGNIPLEEPKRYGEPSSRCMMALSIAISTSPNTMSCSLRLAVSSNTFGKEEEP